MTIVVRIVTCLHRVRRIHKATCCMSRLMRQVRDKNEYESKKSSITHRHTHTNTLRLQVTLKVSESIEYEIVFVTVCLRANCWVFIHRSQSGCYFNVSLCRQ